MNPPVFFGSAALICALVIYTVAFPDNAGNLFSQVQSSISTNASWFYILVVALILAFFGYRHELPLTLRSALYPIIGDKIHGAAGDAIDIFAIIGTVFGVATALGLGVMQVNSGLNYLFDIPVGTVTQIILIIAITALATLSVATGLDKGIASGNDCQRTAILIYPDAFYIRAAQSTGY